MKRAPNLSVSLHFNEKAQISESDESRQRRQKRVVSVVVRIAAMPGLYQARSVPMRYIMMGGPVLKNNTLLSGAGVRVLSVLFGEKSNAVFLKMWRQIFEA